MREALDEAESIGIRKSMEALADADLVLVVIDGSAEISEADSELLCDVAERAAIVVGNKADLGAKQFTVLARLKDMMRRNLVERRIVKKPVAVPAGKGRVGTALQQAEFRRIPLGRTTPE